MIYNEVRLNLSACVPMRINQCPILGTWAIKQLKLVLSLFSFNNILTEKRSQITGQIMYHSLEGLENGKTQEKGLLNGLANVFQPWASLLRIQCDQ